MKSFRNDYSALCHEKILDKLIEIKNEQNIGYGEDIHTKKAKELINNKLGYDRDIYFISGGTLTNSTVISSILRPYEAVICVETGHINVHETGIVEGNGHKILTIKGKDGKIVLDEVDTILKNHMPVHTVLPKMIYISQATEIGSVYTKDELVELYNYCKKNDLLLYLDGARLSSGMAASGLTFEDLALYTDVFYIGATKCGGYLGEAVVFNNKDIANHFEYCQKRFGALLAKGFLTAIPFEVLMEGDLYLSIGKEENRLAMYLQDEMKKLGFKFFSDSKTNQIFPIVTYDMYLKLEQRYGVELWEKLEDNLVVIRFVCGFETKMEDCEDVIKFLKM